MIQLLAATVLLTIMPKHCAEFRNEPQSVTMQRNLRRIWGVGTYALPSSHPTFWWDVSPLSPTGFTTETISLFCSAAIAH